MGAYRKISACATILGSLFYHDPTTEGREGMLAWAQKADTPEAWESGQPEAGRALADLGEAVRDEGAEHIHRSFNRFFVGPYKPPAPAWGSVYTDPESVLFGNETLAVRQWMRDNRVKMNLKDKEPEDQFGLILLMAAWAVNHGVADDQVKSLFEDHLLPWSGRFLELFLEAAADESPRPPMASVPAPLPSKFYASCARLAIATLDDWTDRFGWMPRKVPIRR